jgi:integrase/recombinase XerD
MMAVRNVAIIELLFVSGIRVSELCDLRLCDVNLSCGRLRIVGKGDKERIVDICQRKTLNVLTEWIVFRADAISSNEPFFTSRLGKKLSPQSVRWLVRDVVTDLGIKKHITPHTFRHTFATLLLEEDVDITYIQQLLGHSSIVTTQIYTHVNLQKQHEILSKKHPRRLI